MNTKSDPQCKEKGEEDQEVGDFHVFNCMGDEDDAACELCFVAGSSSSWNNIVPHFQRPWPRVPGLNVDPTKMWTPLKCGLDCPHAPVHMWTWQYVDMSVCPHFIC